MTETTKQILTKLSECIEKLPPCSGICGDFALQVGNPAQPWAPATVKIPSELTVFVQHRSVIEQVVDALGLVSFGEDRYLLHLTVDLPVALVVTFELYHRSPKLFREDSLLFRDHWYIDGPVSGIADCGYNLSQRRLTLLPEAVNPSTVDKEVLAQRVARIQKYLDAGFTIKLNEMVLPPKYHPWQYWEAMCQDLPAGENYAAIDAALKVAGPRCQVFWKFIREVLVPMRFTPGATPAPINYVHMIMTPADREAFVKEMGQRLIYDASDSNEQYRVYKLHEHGVSCARLAICEEYPPNKDLFVEDDLRFTPATEGDLFAGELIAYRMTSCSRAAAISDLSARGLNVNPWVARFQGNDALHAVATIKRLQKVGWKILVGEKLLEVDYSQELHRGLLGMGLKPMTTEQRQAFEALQASVDAAVTQLAAFKALFAQ